MKREKPSDQYWLNKMYRKSESEGTQLVAKTSLSTFEHFCQKETGLNGKSMPEMIEKAEKYAAENGTKFEVVDSMEAAFEDADIVYPKSWGCIDLFEKPEESLELSKKYSDWLCDDDLMRAAKDESVYMHCLPADRGNEVTDSVIDGNHSVVYQEAENRLHTCKAIMALTM